MREKWEVGVVKIDNALVNFTDFWQGLIYIVARTIIDEKVGKKIKKNIADWMKAISVRHFTELDEICGWNDELQA